MRTTLIHARPPAEAGADCVVLTGRGSFLAPLPVAASRSSGPGSWTCVGKPEGVRDDGDSELLATPMIEKAIARIGVPRSEVLDAAEFAAVGLVVDGAPPRLVVVEPWLRKHKNAVVTEVPLDGISASGKRGIRLTHGGTSLGVSANVSGHLVRIELSAERRGIAMSLVAPAPPGSRRSVTWAPPAITGVASAMMEACVEVDGTTTLTLRNEGGVLARRSVRGPRAAPVPYRDEKSRLCFVVEEREGAPVLCAWELPSFREVASVPLTEVPLDLAGSRPYGALTAVGRQSLVVLESDFLATLRVSRRWSLTDISGWSPAPDAVVAFWSEHPLSGPRRRQAWSDGRLEEQTMHGTRTWAVEPARVSALVLGLWKERFWELRPSRPPVPDEAQLQLLVRGPEGEREVSALAHAWRTAPGDRCSDLLEALFGLPG